MKYTVALVGNPNSGKTTLFNALTGSSQRIGNWPGVTVDLVEGVRREGGDTFRIVDLPGIYGLSAKTEDEQVARNFLLTGEYDLAVNILDSTNLERNLYLTTQLMEMGVPCLLVLNMHDLAGEQGIHVDVKHLSTHLRYPALEVSATEPEAVAAVIQAVRGALDNPPEVPPKLVRYPNEIEDLLVTIIDRIKKADPEHPRPRWTAVKLLEEDETVTPEVLRAGWFSRDELEGDIRRVSDILRDSPDVVVANSRYGLIRGVVREVVTKIINRESMTERIDKVVMNPILGVPLFAVAMYLVFWLSISLGGAFIDFFDILSGTLFVDGFGMLLQSVGAPDFLVALLADGIGAGIQTVATFVPVIFFLFLMLSLLEDSGYMSRAAFIMDRFMRWIGLPGKAFVPMLVGFGCTVPAILATRTLDSRKDRIMTIFMSPLMSCGARLPVYALFAAAFFGEQAGLIVFSLYLIGIILAVLTGLIFRTTAFRGEASHLIMELPTYHAPRLRHIMLHTWLRLKDFIFRAGKVIILAVLVLGFLSSFGVDGSIGNQDSEKSVMALLGKKLTPVFGPMGVERDNWPAAVGLFTGVFAKESIVGTLNGLYSQLDAAPANDDGQDSEDGFFLLAGIRNALLSIPAGTAGALGFGDDEEEDPRSFHLLQRRFTAAQAYAYLLFVLVYFPCLAVVATVIREIGSLYTLLFVTYHTLMAWIVATLFYQVAEGHQLAWMLVPLLFFGGLYLILCLMGLKKGQAPAA
ncbi:Fe(2+) transporter permease subunit FeoB [Marispirochaeta sp.]|uniref:Fe(2+) transporter permease subunit FeoB n=1 Tax=Marispirochaeta sp. TaxID=2038653 RepID=UPI0029C85530|nr:Fe(2+) transporter permease subunit FeoB [Marispirochaeta sp.]